MEDVDNEELEALDPLHYSPVDVDGGVLGPPFSIVYDQLLYLADVKGEVVVLAPHCQVTHLLPIGCLIVAASQRFELRTATLLDFSYSTVSRVYQEWSTTQR